MRKTLLVLMAALAIAAPVAVAADSGSKNIVQTAQGAGQFRTLVSLVNRAGLAGTLSGKAQFTVFAPTDAAFKKVPQKTLNALAADKAKLKAVLLYHVVKGKVTSDQVVKLKSARTLNGKSVKIATKNGAVYVNNAKVTTPDVSASNGVIHVINRVLIP